jgi:hypothetical protein
MWSKNKIYPNLTQQVDVRRKTLKLEQGDWKQW